MTWAIKDELEAWWKYNSAEGRKDRLPKISPERRKELYEWSGSSPLFLTILFLPAFQGKTEDQVIEMFTNPEGGATSAFAAVRSDIEEHFHEKLDQLTDDAKTG